MLASFIIVWRESLEALLVLAILLAWVAEQPEAARLRRRIGLGAVLGLLLSVLLAGLTLGASRWMQGEALDAFQAGAALFAALLVLQMLAWMRRHGAGMKASLRAQAGEAVQGGGLALMVALTIAREGCEAAIFLTGQLGSATSLLPALGGAALGLGLALACLTLLERGARWLRGPLLFRVAEGLLLMLAFSMLVQGVERLLAMDWLPSGLDPLWDSSAWLPDTRGIGHGLAQLMGYRDRPSACLAGFYAGFALLAALLLKRPGPQGAGRR